MCGRFSQLDGRLSGIDADLAGEQVLARYNGVPSQDFWVIRRHPKTGRNRTDRLIWGLIPHWVKEPNGGQKPINARAETVSRLPSFRDAYAKRRCIVPVDNFFEWRKTKPPKQPYAIGMEDGSPFALAAIWENWQNPETKNYVRTFCILTCPANALIASIHDRMPVILPPEAYDRWLSPLEQNPIDLLTPFPAEVMRVWPVSARLNSPWHDDPGIINPLE